MCAHAAHASAGRGRRRVPSRIGKAVSRDAYRSPGSRMPTRWRS
ncbi:hypothetical protein TOK_6250 [Pseudonocardia sp. N23]|nr:hypothetical protein TOK_6250 [Pseudonocardia sp. N23]